MREIKFRAWDKESEVMKSFEELAETIAFADVFRNYYTDLEVMQYIGLKDKNGIEIYEGDVLEAADGYAGVIGYRSESAQYVGFNIGHEFADEEYDTLYTEDCIFKSAKVIGNRYENPELLKED